MKTGFWLLLVLLSGRIALAQPAKKVAIRPAVPTKPATRPVPTSGSRSARKQTLYPDTLHPRPLLVSYWTAAQVDSLRAALAADSMSIAQWPQVWTDRYRVIFTDDRSLLRLFYRPLGRDSRWLEIDLSHWQEEYAGQAYITPRVVNLDRAGPDELLVQLGGGNYAQGLRTNLDYTLLISFDGPPRVVWQSLDYRWEEIPPTWTGPNGLEGGSRAERSRTMEVRQGMLYASRVKREGVFDSSGPSLTPITPGYYKYQAGRFKWVKQ